MLVEGIDDHTVHVPQHGFERKRICHAGNYTRASLKSAGVNLDLVSFLSTRLTESAVPAHYYRLVK